MHCRARTIHIGKNCGAWKAVSACSKAKSLRYALRLAPPQLARHRLNESTQTPMRVYARMMSPCHCSRLRSAARKVRSEEHTSELQSLMRISYAVFCLKKKKQ